MIFWETVDFSSLRIENWDGEYTVFQSKSEKTHFLNQMGLHILSLLDQSPSSLEAICQNLANQFQVQLDAHFSVQILRTLHRFEELGLIRRMEEGYFM